MNIAGQLRSGMSVEPAVDTKSASISDGTWVRRRFQGNGSSIFLQTYRPPSLRLGLWNLLATAVRANRNGAFNERLSATSRVREARPSGWTRDHGKAKNRSAIEW